MQNNSLRRERLSDNCWRCLLECVTLIFRDFLSSLMTVSLSSSLTPRPSASVISALTVDALISTGGVWGRGGTWSNRNNYNGEEVTNSRNLLRFQCVISMWKVKAYKYLALRFVSVILSFLHGRGHLVHGNDDGAAGLTQTLRAIQAMRAIHLGEKSVGLDNTMKQLQLKTKNLQHRHSV